MVGSYSASWSELSPSWRTLQAEQVAMARMLHAQQLETQQTIEAITYALHHPVHGAATKMRQMYAAEDALRLQLSHGERASLALELVHTIRGELHRLSAPSVLISVTSAVAATAAFLRVEDRLSRLSLLDADMTRTEFFAQLTRQAEQVRGTIVEACIARVRDGITVRRKNENAPQSGGPSAAACPPAHLCAGETITLAVPSSSASTAQLFLALHSLRATDRLIRELGDIVLEQLLRPLLRYVAEADHGIDTHIDTRTSTGAHAVAIEIRLSASSSLVTAESSSTILDALLAIVDFARQYLFHDEAPSNADITQVAPLATSADSQSLMTRVLAPSMPTLLVQHLCDASLPRNIAALLRYPLEVVPRLLTLERSLMERGVLMCESGDSPPITHFISHLQSQFERSARSRVLQRTKELVVQNEFDAHVFAQTEEEQVREDARFPSAFYSHASHADATLRTRALRLFHRNSMRIFSASTTFAVSNSAFALAQMMYELYFEAQQARSRVSEEWSGQGATREHTRAARARVG